MPRDPRLIADPSVGFENKTSSELVTTPGRRRLTVRFGIWGLEAFVDNLRLKG